MIHRSTHTYWNNKGRYQNIYDKLIEEMPFYGASDDEDIEAIRCISKIVYDVYTNGACNLVGQQHVEDDDEGYYVFDIKWGNHEDKFKTIERYLNGDRQYMNANDTELGKLILDGQAWGGYNDNDLAKLETIMNQVIRKAYATRIARGTKQRDLTTAE